MHEDDIDLDDFEELPMDVEIQSPPGGIAEVWFEPDEAYSLFREVRATGESPFDLIRRLTLAHIAERGGEKSSAGQS